MIPAEAVEQRQLPSSALNAPSFTTTSVPISSKQMASTPSTTWGPLANPKFCATRQGNAASGLDGHKLYTANSNSDRPCLRVAPSDAASFSDRVAPGQPGLQARLCWAKAHAQVSCCPSQPPKPDFTAAHHCCDGEQHTTATLGPHCPANTPSCFPRSFLCRPLNLAGRVWAGMVSPGPTCRIRRDGTVVWAVWASACRDPKCRRLSRGAWPAENGRSG